MSDWLIPLSSVLAAVACFWWARRRSSAAAVESSSARTLHPYRCVAIARAAKSCTAASDLEGRRFLPAEAPLLPLPGCDAAACQCRYARFDDRRDDDRRRPHALERGFASAIGAIERRGEIDRRRSAGFA